MYTAEAVLDICFTELVFCGLSFFSYWLHYFLKLSTLCKKKKIVGEGGLPVFETGILNIFFVHCGNYRAATW